MQVADAILDVGGDGLTDRGDTIYTSHHSSYGGGIKCYGSVPNVCTAKLCFPPVPKEIELMPYVTSADQDRLCICSVWSGPTQIRCCMDQHSFPLFQQFFVETSR